MESVKIIGLCLLAAVTYGILHDQVTARVCVEYFTIGHPPIFGTDHPTLLAIGWGILATWWVGIILGIPLAIAARAGSSPGRSAVSLVRPVVCLMAIMAVCAFLAGLAGWFAAQAGWVYLLGRLRSAVPADRHVAFIADLWAHAASYLSGFIGGVLLIVRLWHSRSRDSRKGSVLFSTSNSQENSRCRR